MNTVFIVLLLLYAIICLKSLSLGATIMVFVRFFVPSIVRVYSTSLNTAMTAILFIACFFNYLANKENRKKMFYSAFPFQYLIIPIALLCLFGFLPYDFQYKNLLQFTVTEILPFSLVFYSISQPSEVDRLIKVWCIAIFITSIYGIITYLIHSNPLILLCAYTFQYGGELYLGDEGDVIRGAMEGYATGISVNSLVWGQTCLICLLFISLFPKFDKYKYFKILLFFLISLNCFLSTKRSVIVPFLLLCTYILLHRYRFNKNNLRKLSFGIILIVLSLFYMSNNSGMRDLYDKNIKTSILFWDDNIAKDNDIGGSSFEMRYEQTIYLHKLLGAYFLQGLGYGFPSWHGEKYGGNTDMRHFESIFYQILSQSGYIGMVVWIIFFMKCILYGKKSWNSSKDRNIYYLCYIVSLILTGIQSSLYAFMIFEAIIIKNSHSDFVQKCNKDINRAL